MELPKEGEKFYYEGNSRNNFFTMSIRTTQVFLPLPLPFLCCVGLKIFTISIPIGAISSQ